jgi:hypothetical protein
MLPIIPIPLLEMLPINATFHNTIWTPGPQSHIPTPVILSVIFLAILLLLIMCLVKYSESTFPDSAKSLY